MKKPKTKDLVEVDMMRTMIIKLFRRIGEQPELKEQWSKLANAERTYIAGDFYNIIMKNLPPQKVDGNGLVYMVSIVNVDVHDVRYICSTESRAMELFEELRQESINDIEEIISYHKSNLKQSSSLMVDDNVNEYHQHGLEYETMRKKFLMEMKSGMVPPFSVDRPLIEVFPLMTEMKKKDDTVNTVNKTNEKENNR
jgi:hypothetical protein